MDGPEEIRTTVARKVKGVTQQPSSGQGTATTRVTLKAGLACDIEDGSWKITADMSEKWGGTNAGPNPGILGRGALGSWLAIGYGVWAARLGIPIDTLEVEVQGDYDVRGEAMIIATASSPVASTELHGSTQR